jgi:hypothetical protein
LRQLFHETGFSRHELHRIGRIPILAKSTLAVIYGERQNGSK